jgi:3-dehydroquinate dehydratase-2
VKILIINGPNLNLLGKRQPDVYGNKTFEDVFEKLKTEFSGLTLTYFQSNHEGEIIDQIHKADGVYSGIVLNAGAYTHTSIAIADAISSVDIPVVEVHISNIYKRESFRHKSIIAPYCKGSISGFGIDSYRLGLLSFIK